MGKRIYCGNLGYGVTNIDLETLFSAYGAVQSAQVVMDRDTGKSKGFGFVEMQNEGDAQKAIKALHETMHDGRNLQVTEARPREERSGSRGGGRPGGYRR